MRREHFACVFLALLTMVASPAGADTVPDNGLNTAAMPLDVEHYPAPGQVMMITDGLPPSSPVLIDVLLQRPSPGASEAPGGSLGGTVAIATELLAMELTGTGSFAGYHRPLAMPLQLEIHTAPRTPGNPVQSFDTDMFLMQGQITGDPDFDLLRITGGTGFGLPSPGHTTLTQQPGNTWAVDSFFDITYRIDFVGAPGGPFAGRSGSTTGTIRLQSTPVPLPSAAWMSLALFGAVGIGRLWRRRQG